MSEQSLHPGIICSIALIPALLVDANGIIKLSPASQNPQEIVSQLSKAILLAKLRTDQSELSLDHRPFMMPEGRSLGADIPSPLHIIKRGKSMQVLRSNLRNTSSDSFNGGPDQPLTVVKNRKSQSRVCGSKGHREINGPAHGGVSERRSQSVTIDTGEAFQLQWGSLFFINREVVVSKKACDPVTPKVSKASAPRRSSSLQVKQPVSPTFLTKLRSLSKGRTLSSRTTRRRYDSRVSSGCSDGSLFKLSDESVAGSCDLSSGPDNPEPPSFLSESESYVFDDNPFASVQTFNGNAPDPYVLVPHVSVTPESRTLNDGQSNLWVAIEISGQLFRPHTGNSSQSLPYASESQPPFIPVHHCDAGLSRYGYLYDIKVDILPTTESSVVDLIGDTAIRTVSPGSSHLILACIRLGASRAYQPRASKRVSDTLIADLESQLGDIRIEYMQVRVNYCHSGFPAFGASLSEDGISAYQTRLETATTGTIKRQNPTSMWSPRPTPISNPLFTVIASHWGPTRANEVMHKIMSNRSSPRRAGTSQTSRGEDIVKPPSRTGTAPPVPRRQASLKRSSPEKITDPARKIWTEMRRTSSGHRPAFHVSKANRLPAATTFVDVPNPGAAARPAPARSESKAEVQRQRELIRETAVRNKRSIGADSLKSLVPSVAETSPGDKENRKSVPDSPSPRGKQDLHFDGRKREGRWSLGGWW
ncbi:hypothetical protein AAE478_001729 [Parahypoxylon ruwenzoriense]